jgi:peptidoglycan/xylan/chitin deacetylase (PgdA/CDA1 family)
MNDRLLILEYHRVAEEGPDSLRPWRLTRREFEEQMLHLSAVGANVVSAEDWFDSASPKHRCVAITFDDAFRDFADTAWPILKRAGFLATVYVPTGHVGRAADWDAGHGTPAALMSWDQIRLLSRDGVRFGAHSHTHRPLIELGASDLLRELTLSKSMLEDALGVRVETVAYPYGCHNGNVRATALEAGYRFGVTVDDGECDRASKRFELPRFEVNGGRGFEYFKSRIDRFLQIN